MYSDSSIQALESRIGFGKPSDGLPSIADTLQNGESGRTVPYFHSLATLTNIYNTVEKANMSQSELEAKLTEIRKESARSVLTEVLNKNKKYQHDFDYDDTITNNLELFDDAIGYTMAIKVLEQILSTTRSNDDERKAKLSYSQLMVQLNGLTDDNGKVLAKGLRREQYYAIKSATKKIFPATYNIFAPDFW